jgi:hypothetical protein
MDNIERGRIIWLTKVIDSRENPTEDHRAIILTTNADYKAGKPIQAAYISSKLKYTTEDCMAKLAHSNDGPHPRTGLTKPSAVICDWINKNVDEDNITSYERLIYGDKLTEIMTKVANCSTSPPTAPAPPTPAPASPTSAPRSPPASGGARSGSAGAGIPDKGNAGDEKSTQ